MFEKWASFVVFQQNRVALCTLRAARFHAFSLHNAIHIVQFSFFKQGLGELAALVTKKTDRETTKNFISKRVDSYRAAYGHRVEDHPRHCIFIGTTNTTDFLRDDTGNRRFWPVRLGDRPPVKTIWGDLTQSVIDQLWAEAVTRYRNGEELILPPELEEYAQLQQMQFTEDDPRRGLVEEFLKVLLPSDWKTRSREERQSWFMESEDIRIKGEIQRECISAIEVWTECLGNSPGRFSRLDRVEINSILRAIKSNQLNFDSIADTLRRKEARI